VCKFLTDVFPPPNVVTSSGGDFTYLTSISFRIRSVNLKNEPKDSATGKATKEDNSSQTPLTRVVSREGNYVEERGLDDSELYVEFERDFEIDALD